MRFSMILGTGNDSFGKAELGFRYSTAMAYICDLIK